jgi:hypothetical protein
LRLRPRRRVLILSLLQASRLMSRLMSHHPRSPPQSKARSDSVAQHKSPGIHAGIVTLRLCCDSQLIISTQFMR